MRSTRSAAGSRLLRKQAPNIMRLLSGIAADRASVFVVVLDLLASVPGPSAAQAPADRLGNAEPHFRADGPDADAYGRKEGYPACTGLTYIRDLRCRVGAFSHFDDLFPSRTISASKPPSPLRRAGAEASIRYTFNGESRTHDRYLDTHHVTGLPIAKGDSILLERYRYGRTDKHRLTSFSMAKAVIGLLIGIALATAATDNRRLQIEGRDERASRRGKEDE